MFERWRHNLLPLGLDIGRTGLRGVQLRRQGARWVVHAAWELGAAGGQAAPWEAALTEPADGPDLTAAERELVAHLRRLLARGSFVGREVVVHCPAERLDLRPVELPAGSDGLPRDAVLGALRLEMAGQLAFAPDQAVFDYFPLAMVPSVGRMRLIAVTADGAWIRRRLRLLQAAGLDCTAVEALPCVLARLAGWLAAAAPPPAGVPAEAGLRPLTALVDVGYSGSTLIAAEPCGPVFCRRYPLGGREMTRLLAERLGVGEPAAERLKRTYGIDCQSRQLRAAPQTAPASGAEPAAEAVSSGGAGPEDRPDHEIGKTIFAALAGGLAGWVEGLTRALNYVVAREAHLRLEKVLLYGRGAYTRNLGVFLTRQFGLPVQHAEGELLRQITSCLPCTRACEGSWTTALGLALPREVRP